MKKFLLIVSCSLLVQSLFAQWTKLNGPHGNWISNIAYVDPSKIYCSSFNSNLYYSLDSGNTWQKDPSNQFEGNIQALTAGENKIIVTTLQSQGTPDSYISLDSGSTFVPLLQPFSDSLPYYPPLIKIFSTGIYSSGAAGFYRSTDNGASWTTLNFDIPDSSLMADYAAYGNKLMVIAEDVLYFSDNNSTWTPLVIDSSQSLYPHKVRESNGMVYVTTSIGIFRTSDDGQSWTNIGGLDFQNFPLNEFELMDEKILLYADLELWYADSSALVWTNSNIITTGNSAFILDTEKIGTVLLAASSKGIYKNNPDFTAVTSFSSHGIECVGPEGFLADGNSFHVGDNFGYAVSNDGGVTWTEKLEPSSIYEIKKFGADVFLCKYADLYLTASGSSAINYQSAMPANDLTKTDDQKLYGVSPGLGIFSSDNNGVSFSPANGNLPDLDFYSITSIGNNIIAGNGFNGIYLSTDEGLTWTLTGASGYGIYDLTRHNNLIFASVSTFNTMFSADSGLTWQPCLNSLGVLENQIISNGNELFVVHNGDMAEMSIDDGQTWIDLTPFIQPGQFGEIASVYATSDKLYFATWLRGIWWISLPDLTRITETSQKNSFSIFPNPATDRTTIRRDGNSTGSYTITDMRGSIVSSGELKSSETIISTERFSQGIYNVRVLTGDEPASAFKLVKY